MASSSDEKPVLEFVKRWEMPKMKHLSDKVVHYVDYSVFWKEYLISVTQKNNYGLFVICDENMEFESKKTEKLNMFLNYLYKRNFKVHFQEKKLWIYLTTDVSSGRMYFVMIEREMYCIVPYDPLISHESNIQTPFFLFVRATRPDDHKEMNQCLYISLKYIFSNLTANMHKFEIHAKSTLGNLIFIAFKPFADVTYEFIYSTPFIDYCYLGEHCRLIFFIEKHQITIKSLTGKSLTRRLPGTGGVFFLCQEIGFPRVLEIQFNTFNNSLYILSYNCLITSNEKVRKIGVFKMPDSFHYDDSSKIEFYFNPHSNLLVIAYLKTLYIDIYRFTEQIV